MTGEQPIEHLVQKVQSLPDANARETALALVQAVMELHASGVGRMMEIVAGSEAVASVMDAFAADNLVSGMLLLHDLHPLDLESRVLRALDHPDFRARGASVEVVSIHDGLVRVRVEGGTGLRAAVEAALGEAAPDAEAILIDGASETGGGNFVPLAQLMAG